MQGFSISSSTVIFQFCFFVQWQWQWERGREGDGEGGWLKQSIYARKLRRLQSPRREGWKWQWQCYHCDESTMSFPECCSHIFTAWPWNREDDMLLIKIGEGGGVYFLLDRGCLNLMMDIKNKILINYLILTWICLPSLTQTEMCLVGVDNIFKITPFIRIKNNLCNNDHENAMKPPDQFRCISPWHFI